MNTGKEIIPAVNPDVKSWLREMNKYRAVITPMGQGYPIIHIHKAGNACFYTVKPQVNECSCYASVVMYKQCRHLQMASWLMRFFACPLHPLHDTHDLAQSYAVEPETSHLVCLHCESLRKLAQGRTAPGTWSGLELTSEEAQIASKIIAASSH